MGVRQDRLGDRIKDLLATFLLSGKLGDPRLADVVVTSVALSADLQNAKVYFRTYGEGGNKAAIQKALTKAKGRFRTHLAQNLDVRRAPELSFFHDESIENASRIEELLRNLNQTK